MSLFACHVEFSIAPALHNSILMFVLIRENITSNLNEILPRKKTLLP